ncbi:MAG TPA: ElyC/SanA/YdcF family protein, partial [Allocoleopsis sp.]
RPLKDVQSVTFGKSQMLAAFLILLIFSLPITAYLFTAQTEQRTALEASQRPAGNVQAIVVLGDGTLPTDPAYRMRTQLSNPANGLSVTLESRLLYAAQLYNNQVAQGNNPFIVVSAGPQALLVRPGVTASDAINTFLGKAGVPAEQIRIDTESVDARTSAVHIREIFLGPQAGEAECTDYTVCRNNGSLQIQQQPSQSEVGPVLPIILVAPAITIRRATSAFINVNYEVTPRATDFYVFQIQGGLRPAAVTDLIPSAEALVITTRAIDEYWAWVYYFLRGWLSDPLNV